MSYPRDRNFSRPFDRCDVEGSRGRPIHDGHHQLEYSRDRGHYRPNYNRDKNEPRWGERDNRSKSSHRNSKWKNSRYKQNHYSQQRRRWENPRRDFRNYNHLDEQTSFDQDFYFNNFDNSFEGDLQQRRICEVEHIPSLFEVVDLPSAPIFPNDTSQENWDSVGEATAEFSNVTSQEGSKAVKELADIPLASELPNVTLERDWDSVGEAAAEFSNVTSQEGSKAVKELADIPLAPEFSNEVSNTIKPLISVVPLDILTGSRHLEKDTKFPIGLSNSHTTETFSENIFNGNRNEKETDCDYFIKVKLEEEQHNVNETQNPENNIESSSVTKKTPEEITEKLVNQVARMDKYNIKNMINNPLMKFDAALKLHGRKKLREQIRQQLKTINFDDFDKTISNQFEVDAYIDSDNLPEKALIEISKVLNINIYNEKERCNITEPCKDIIENRSSTIIDTQNSNELVSLHEENSCESVVDIKPSIPLFSMDRNNTTSTSDVIILSDSSNSDCESESTSSSCRILSKHLKTRKKSVQEKIVDSFQKTVLPNVPLQERQKYEAKDNSNVSNAIHNIYNMCINRLGESDEIAKRFSRDTRNSPKTISDEQAVQTLMDNIQNLFQKEKCDSIEPSPDHDHQIEHKSSKDKHNEKLKSSPRKRQRSGKDETKSDKPAPKKTSSGSKKKRYNEKNTLLQSSSGHSESTENTSSKTETTCDKGNGKKHYDSKKHKDNREIKENSKKAETLEKEGTKTKPKDKTTNESYRSKRPYSSNKTTPRTGVKDLEGKPNSCRIDEKCSTTEDRVPKRNQAREKVEQKANKNRKESREKNNPQSANSHRKTNENVDVSSYRCSSKTTCTRDEMTTNMETACNKTNNDSICRITFSDSSDRLRGVNETKALKAGNKSKISSKGNQQPVELNVRHSLDTSQSIGIASKDNHLEHFRPINESEAKSAPLNILTKERPVANLVNEINETPIDGQVINPDTSINNCSLDEATNKNNENSIKSLNRCENKPRKWKSPGEKKCLVEPIQVIESSLKSSELLTAQTPLCSPHSTNQNLIDSSKEEHNERIANTLTPVDCSSSEKSDTPVSTGDANVLSQIQLIQNLFEMNQADNLRIQTMMQQNKISDAVLNSLKDYDFKLMELQKQKMFIEEMMLKWQKQKMDIEVTTIKLQTEKYLILNSILGHSNLQAPHIKANDVNQFPLLSMESMNHPNSLMNNSLNITTLLSNLNQMNDLNEGKNNKTKKSAPKKKQIPKKPNTSAKLSNRKKRCQKDILLEDAANAIFRSDEDKKPDILNMPSRRSKSISVSPSKTLAPTLSPSSEGDKTTGSNGTTTATDSINPNDKNSAECAQRIKTEKSYTDLQDSDHPMNHNNSNRDHNSSQNLRECKVVLEKLDVSDQDFSVCIYDGKDVEQLVISDDDDDDDNNTNNSTFDMNFVEEPLKISNGKLEGHKMPIICIEIVNKHLIAASEDGNIYKFNLLNHDLESVFAKHTESVTQIKILRKNYIYSISLDGYMKKTSIENFGLELSSVNIQEPLQSIDLEWDTAFIGSRWGNIFTYNVKTSKLSDILLCSLGSSIMAIKATKEGPRRILIISSKGNEINLRDARNGLLLRIISIPKEVSVYTLIMNEGQIYCGTNKNEIYSYDFTSGNKVSTYACGNGAVSMKLYKENLLFVGCYDGFIYVINKSTGAQLGRFPGSGKILLSIDIVADKLITSSRDSNMQVMDIPKYILALVK